MAAEVATDDVVEDKAAADDTVVVDDKAVVKHISSTIDLSEIAAVISRSKIEYVAIFVNI